MLQLPDLIACVLTATLLVVIFAYGRRPLCFSPSVYFLSSWLAVYSYVLLDPGAHLSIISVCVLFVFNLAFVVGEFATQRWDGGERATQAATRLKKTKLSEKRIKILTSVLSVVSVLTTYGYVTALNFSEYSDTLAGALLYAGSVRADLAEGDITVSYAGRLGFIFAYISVITALIYYIYFRWRWWLVVPFACVFILVFSQAARAGIIIVLVQAAIAVIFKGSISHQVDSQKVTAKLGWFALFIIFIFIFGQLFREGFSYLDVSDVFRIMGGLRGYFSGGVLGFDYWINHVYSNDDDLTLGKYTFSGIYQALGIAKQELGVYNVYVPIDNMGGVTNIYTGHRQLIEDFGFVSATLLISVCSAVLAFIGQRWYAISVSTVAMLIPLYSLLVLFPLYSLTLFSSFVASVLVPPVVVRICRGVDE
jgi:oligosaccharide repeat unit polymerase